MKLICFIFICGIFPFTLLAQTNDSISVATKDFFSEADEYYKKYATNKSINESYSSEDALKLAKKFYKAKAEDPYGFRNYLRKLARIRDEKFRNTRVLEPKGGVKVRLIKNLISEKMGDRFVAIIEIPFYLKIKVLEIESGKYISKEDERIVAPTTIIKAEIEEIIKGEKFFKKNSIIDVNLINQWMSGTNKFFEVNKEYFIPLEPWNCYEDECTGLRLSFLPDNDYGIYPIENEVLKTNDDYFGFGNQVDWSTFKESFISTYIIK